jgi:ketosteroid isomerase-like protein
MDASEVVRIVEAFTDATNRQDVERMLDLVSDDVLFEGRPHRTVFGSRATRRHCALCGKAFSAIPLARLSRPRN